jgi:hypothetical protein
MNFKNFKPFERIPTDIQMIICKNAHTLVYEEVMRELIKITVKNTLLLFEDWIKHFDDENKEGYLQIELLTTTYSEGDFDLVPSYFNILKQCNCCEYHISYKPLSIKERNGIECDYLPSELYTDNCKCPCSRFAYVCRDTDEEYYDLCDLCNNDPRECIANSVVLIDGIVLNAVHFE